MTFLSSNQSNFETTFFSSTQRNADGNDRQASAVETDNATSHTMLLPTSQSSSWTTPNLTVTFLRYHFLLSVLLLLAANSVTSAFIPISPSFQSQHQQSHFRPASPLLAPAANPLHSQPPHPK